MKRKFAIRAACITAAASMLLTGCNYTDFMDFVIDEWGVSQESGDSRPEEGQESGEGRRAPERDTDGGYDPELAFDDFVQEIFCEMVEGDTITLHFTLAEPEAYGIEPGEPSLGGYGYEDKKESLEELQAYREQLGAYEYEELDRDQRITADILDYYLDICEKDIRFDYYSEPLRPQTGVHINMPYLFAEYVFYERQDVEDYLALLSQLEDYFAEILAWEREKAAAGLAMPDELLDMVIEECGAFLWDGDESFFLVSTFRERLDGLEELTEEEKAACEERQRELLRGAFSSAYESLRRGLEELKGTGTNDQGVCYYPMGREYYEYLIESGIGMTYASVEELFDEAAANIEEIYSQMNAVLNRGEDILDLWLEEPEDDRAPEAMLEDLRERITEEFPRTAIDSSYRLKKVSEAMEDMVSPAFYMIPPIDRYTDNNIYINEGKLDGGYNLYSVLAHEGYPGHLYQTVYFAGTDACDLRKLLSFSGYSEGWGTYAEYYSFRYLDHLPKELRELDCLESRLDLTLSALMDIGVNYYGWTREEMARVCEELTGLPGEDVADSLYPYLIGSPAEYLNYYVGCLEIEKLQREAERTLGIAYRPAEFHRFLLDFGSAPFSVIRPYFDEWLEERRASAPLPDVNYAITHMEAGDFWQNFQISSYRG